MTEGGWHGQVAQAELGAAVIVVARQHAPPSLPVALAPVVPAFQVLRHQRLVHVFGQQLVSGPFSAARGPHCRVGVLGKTVCPVAAVLPESVVSVVAVHLVGRVDVVVALHFILIHVGSVVVRLHVRTGVAADVEGTGCIVCRGLTRVTTT